MENSAPSKQMDPEMKVNLAALKKCDEFVIDIVETSSQVAVYKFDPIRAAWEKTEVEGSLFFYRRSTLPKFALMIMNRLNRKNLNVNIAKEMEFKIQKPFLLYKNSSMDIQGIWFNNPEKCEKIGKLIVGLHASPVPQQESTSNKQPTERPKQDEKSILTMFANAERRYNENKLDMATNGPTPSSQNTPKARSKSLSNIPQPSRQSAAPSSSITTLALLPAPIENRDQEQSTVDHHDPCIIRSSPLRPSGTVSNSQGAVLSKSLPNSEKKNTQRQLFTSEPTPFPSQLPSTDKTPFPSISNTQSTTVSPSKTSTKMRSSGTPGQKSGSDITLAASLMSPLAFKSTKPTTTVVSNHRPETPILTKEQLQDTLLYLIEKDSDFLEKIHATYLKNVNG